MAEILMDKNIDELQVEDMVKERRMEAIESYLDGCNINSDFKGYLYLVDAIEEYIRNITNPNPQILSYLAEKYKINKNMVSVTMKKALTRGGVKDSPVSFVRQAALFLVQQPRQG